MSTSTSTRPVDHCAGANVALPHAADPHADAAARRVGTLEQQQIAIGQKVSIGNVEIAETADGELSGLRAADQEGEDIAGAVEAAF
jgi:hypothetical protein